MVPRRAAAFAPGAITNFFKIHYGPNHELLGATGGGYVLSEGTVSRATFSPGPEVTFASEVDGDPNYDARTTRRAVQLLLHGVGGRGGGLKLEQSMGTPVGSGFGASAASAVSAVYSAASAIGVRKPKAFLANFAHRAEIIEQTGLGTVSVVYDGVGAGAIVKPGLPGVARFKNVLVPEDTRIVTAYLAPFDKKDALSSRPVSDRINRLGGAALRRFMDNPDLDNLASEGERFSRSLGLETPEVKKLISVALSAGATHASQNMIGYAIHALVDEDRSRRVASRLSAVGREVRVDVFRVGSMRAGTTRPSRRRPGPS